LYVNEIEITEKIINLTFKSVFRKCLINTPLILLAIPGQPQKVINCGAREYISHLYV
jgi:hypothetical protein